MPMRKHELIYVFYRKLPLYDLSSHSHKFLGHINTIKPNCYNECEPYDHIKYNPPLPVSIIKEEKNECYGEGSHDSEYIGEARKANVYDPPLPNSILEIKSEKGKHATQKPIELIKWILKYYSKIGDTVLDPTMGSGSTGVACKAMNRNFIGIEKDDTIYKDAIERINKI